jgi:cell division protein FtsW
MLRAGHLVFLCALCLLCLGVVMVNSATMHVTPIGSADGPRALNGTDPSANASSLSMVLRGILYSRATVYLALAIGTMALAAWLAPVQWLDRVSQAARERNPRLGVSVVVVGSLVLVVLQILPFIAGFGRAINGSHRWIHITLPGAGELSIQPSEIAKWGLIGLLAWYATLRAQVMSSFRRGLIPGLCATGVVSAAVVKEDLGTGLLIASAGCLVLTAGGARVWQFLAFVPLGAVGLVAAIVSNPYRLERLQTFLDPYADPKGTGYHMIQSMLAVSGGEGPGRGLGHGLMKFGYLPEDHNDFLYAIICEELGIFGAALVACLFVGLLWSGLAIIRKQHSMMLKLIGLGIVGTVGLQAIINQVVVTGLGPTKGIALPLVSSGGTGWILTAASLGVLIAMDRVVAAARTSTESDAITGAPAPPADTRLAGA